MSLLTVNGIAKSYGLQQVLQSVSFIVGPGEKVALVGRNGCGKTTLLRLIAGVEAPDTGAISLLPGTHVGHLAQDVDLSGGETLLSAVANAVPRLVAMEQRLRELEAQLEAGAPGAESAYAAYAELQQEFAQAGGPAYPGRVKATLAGLGFRESDFSLPVAALSGGQRTRAGLCMLLLQEPDLLLLDEPTNHLDLPAIEWLEEYLGRTRSALLIVSHDRYFLDQVVSRVVELDGGKLFSYPGNYTAYARLREARLQQQQVEWERNQEQAAKLEDYIRRYRVSRATQAKSREKALARIQLDKPRTREAELRLHLTAGLRSGTEVLRIERLAKAYADKQLFQSLDLVVQRGERVGVVGPNGSGKTTLLKILVGQAQADSGYFAFGHNVEPGYFAQDLSGAQPENTLLDEILDAGAATYEEARSLLARFLFFGDDVFKRVGDLSGGETNRLALARIFLSHANLLLLDEPTNHLDIAARDRLEETLLAFSGTIIFASHDRYLLDRVATRIVEVAGGEAKVYNDTYAEYRRRKERERLLAAQAAARAERAAAAAARPAPRPMARGARPQDLRRAVKAVEERIAAAEARASELEAILADPSSYTDADRVKEATAEYEALSASLPELIAEWERLAEQVEAISAG
ncbi:MAG: ABC-F family ATP-binding cassette domain-containing protein [Armatimonadetes bacterium]|nr:ABC-F family ATP-binding cassette domain-containing protein [Armatimonadota bacterium]